jgi:TRAP-type C4-dicarboxylate transport system permease small subunit
MKRPLLDYLDRALSGALVISALAMVLVVVLQIVARFALPWSPHWTEEVARYCFVYLVSLGAGLALKDNAYVGVTVFLDQLPGRARQYLEGGILLAIAGLMGSMLVACVPLLKIVRLQSSAALQVNMAFVYFSMVVMSFFVLLYAVVRFIHKLRHP